MHACVCMCGVPKLSQLGRSPNLSWNSQTRASPTPKEGATFGWDNPVPIGRPKGTYQRPYLAYMRITPHL